MLSAFGRAIARQACVASSLSIRSTSRLAVPVIPSGFRVVAVFTRGFAAAGAPKRKTGTKTATSAASKKTPAAKKPAKKAAAKKKPAKKAAKPKAKAVKKPKTTKAKKELTDEEKAKIKIRALKAKALLKEQPGQLPVTAWTLFIFKNLKEALNKDPKPEFRDVMTQLSADYKALPEHEKEKLESEALKNKTANEIAFKNWVESHTVQEIRTANLARNMLRRAHSISAKSTIPDPRFPKRPLTPYMAYVKSRYPAPEFEGVPNPTRLSKISAEWKTRGPEERKPYEKIAETDSARFKKEMDAFREGA